jgi:hypothetical protein
MESGTNVKTMLLEDLDSPVLEKAGESSNSLPGPDVLWWSVGASFFVPLNFTPLILHFFPPIAIRHFDFGGNLSDRSRTTDDNRYGHDTVQFVDVLQKTGNSLKRCAYYMNKTTG